MTGAFCRYYHPTRFAPPRRRSHNCSEIVSCVERLRSCYKAASSTGRSATKCNLTSYLWLVAAKFAGLCTFFSRLSRL